MKRTLPDWPCVRPDASKDGKTFAAQRGDSTDSQPRSWPVLRLQPCPVEREERYRGPELHAYASEGWWTAEGARLKARRLQKAGLPNFKNWRFVTLTMATRSMLPLVAYRHGKDRLRRFLARVRKAIGRRFLWCWKLEFHDDGYAHWHLLIEYTDRLPLEILSDLEEWWGLGRVNVRRVNGRDIRYVFKYVAKGPEDVPEWVARYKGTLRVFQASQGFYTRRKKRVAKRTAPKFSVLRVDLSTRQVWDMRKALLVSTNHRGERRVRVVKLRVTFNALLSMRAYESIQKRKQLAPPGVVNVSQHEALILEYEHRNSAGLACIHPNTAFAA